VFRGISGPFCGRKLRTVGTLPIVQSATSSGGRSLCTFARLLACRKDGAAQQLSVTTDCSVELRIGTRGMAEKGTTPQPSDFL